MNLLTFNNYNSPSEIREGSNNPLLPNSARARHPPCHALSVSWKLVSEQRQVLLGLAFPFQISFFIANS